MTKSRSDPGGYEKKVLKPSQRREIALEAVAQKDISVRKACIYSHCCPINSDGITDK